MKKRQRYISFIILMFLTILFNLYYTTFYDIIEYATDPSDSLPFDTMHENTITNLSNANNAISDGSGAVFDQFIVLKKTDFFSHIRNYYIPIGLFLEMKVFNSKIFEYLEEEGISTNSPENLPDDVYKYSSDINTLFKNLGTIIDNNTAYKTDIGKIIKNYVNENRDINYDFTSDDFTSDDFKTIYDENDAALNSIRAFYNKKQLIDLKIIESDEASRPDFLIIIATMLYELEEIQVKLNNEYYNKKIQEALKYFPTLIKDSHNNYLNDIYEYIEIGTISSADGNDSLQEDYGYHNAYNNNNDVINIDLSDFVKKDEIKDLITMDDVETFLKRKGAAF